ncbi:alpha-ketoglutarate-dependent dioxygenase AlkB [uncultured Chryseobacterium sp.]|uniref:alpha-ketoglutarate-dependent dioxygenase AlkB family protein n=1 Tax=uncultured Chryseobacterium sp. TaxID=259322 RepID=UPI0025F5906F|nr:alpha-ketoglutarate-dependent dioxygenase AlkB [uncultured Chryseobacterium sp.]
MQQLSLFNSDEFYRFPDQLLDYTEQFLAKEEADRLIRLLIDTVPWEQTLQKIRDKTVVTPRLTAWYGDPDTSYQIGKKAVTAHPWLPELLDLKKRIENETDCRFNSVLLNLYRNGHDSVAWHRDKTHATETLSSIASLSLGQVRNFDFRKLDDHRQKHSISLAHGSLLIMKGNLQTEWEHRIAKSSELMRPRINLTFRMIREL